MSETVAAPMTIGHLDEAWQMPCEVKRPDCARPAEWILKFAECCETAKRSGGFCCTPCKERLLRMRTATCLHCGHQFKPASSGLLFSEILNGGGS